MMHQHHINNITIVPPQLADFHFFLSNPFVLYLFEILMTSGDFYGLQGPFLKQIPCTELGPNCPLARRRSGKVGSRGPPELSCAVKSSLYTAVWVEDTFCSIVSSLYIASCIFNLTKIRAGLGHYTPILLAPAEGRGPPSPAEGVFIALKILIYQNSTTYMKFKLEALYRPNRQLLSNYIQWGHLSNSIDQLATVVKP